MSRQDVGLLVIGAVMAPMIVGTRDYCKAVNADHLQFFRNLNLVALTIFIATRLLTGEIALGLGMTGLALFAYAARRYTDRKRKGPSA